MTEFERIAENCLKAEEQQKDEIAKIVSGAGRTGEGTRNERPLLPAAMKWKKPPANFKQHKNSRRSKEDSEIFLIRGMDVEEPDLIDEPDSVEELLRACEAELMTRKDHSFDDPRGRDWRLAKSLNVNAWIELKAGDTVTATLTVFKLGRVLERLRVAEIEAKRDKPSKADGYLEEKFYDAWKSLRTDDEPDPSFGQVFYTLEEKGIIKEKLAYTKHKNPDGSHIKKPSGRWQWKEPGIREYQTLAFRRLESLFDGWRKEWLRPVNKRDRG